MLTGEPPSSRSEKRVCEQLGKRRIPPPLVRFCVECLRKAPRDRPSAGEVATSLRTYLGRTRRRLRYGVAAALGLAVLLFVAAVQLERRDSEARANRGEPPRYGQS